MNDTVTSIEQLKEKAALLVRERDWEQFHSPQSLSMSIVREATELMEKFLWLNTQEAYKKVEEDRQGVEHELADVIIATLIFANETHIDIARAVSVKLAEIAHKYPVDKAKGRSAKYTEL